MISLLGLLVRHDYSNDGNSHRNKALQIRKQLVEPSTFKIMLGGNSSDLLETSLTVVEK
jgi:hypothetical protein